MNTQEMIKEINVMKEKVSESNKKRYNFQLTERMILRLDSFTDCSECRTLLNECSSVIEDMRNDALITVNKKYTLFIKKVTVHLQKSHQLITEGYYTNMYMAYGIAIGLPFGVVFSQLLGQMAFIGIGLPIGIAIGLSIGTKLDSQVKKDGLII